MGGAGGGQEASFSPCPNLSALRWLLHLGRELGGLDLDHDHQTTAWASSPGVFFAVLASICNGALAADGNFAGIPVPVHFSLTGAGLVPGHQRARSITSRMGELAPGHQASFGDGSRGGKYLPVGDHAVDRHPAAGTGRSPHTLALNYPTLPLVALTI